MGSEEGSGKGCPHVYICVKLFHSGNNLKTHFESHTGESAVKCRCCAKVFSCWRLTWSGYTEERLSACELCAKAFSSGNNLKIHIKGWGKANADIEDAVTNILPKPQS